MCRNRAGAAVLLLLLWLGWGTAVTTTLAQEETLTLRLSRDFGSSNGIGIRGTFSMRVTGPEELQAVHFFIDNLQVGVDNEAPFRLQFRTTEFPTGAHILHARGVTASGVTLESNTLTRNFMTAAENTNAILWIVVPILILTLGGRYLAGRIANRGRRAEGKATIEGPLGGTICPNCGRPYAIHLWSPRVVTVRFDRCPHCGKWHVAHRAHPDALNAALDADANTPDEIPPTDNLSQKLDDSRFTSE